MGPTEGLDAGTQLKSLTEESWTSKITDPSTDTQTMVSSTFSYKGDKMEPNEASRPNKYKNKKLGTDDQDQGLYLVSQSPKTEILEHQNPATNKADQYIYKEL